MASVVLDRHGSVSVITTDNPPVNALSHEVRAGLLEGIERANADSETDAIVVICAGRTFFAGADIREFDQPPRPPHLPDVVAHIEASAKPVLAAIHGTALGGGLEIAMGCHYRIASATARVGLPEVKLGLLPGATGTQRLPRLVGVERALDMMLSGEPVAAHDAMKAGLIDRVTESADLLAEALTYAAALAQRGPRRVRDLDVPPADAAVFAAARADLARKARGLPAPQRNVDLVEAATRLDFDSGCREEREAFVECRQSPESRGLRHAFFAEREAAKVPGLSPQARAREIEKVAVIGAGTMGSGIAYACLAAGLPVHLIDNDEAGLARGVSAIERLYRGGVERGKVSPDAMRAGLGRFSHGTGYQDVRDADLVIEAVFENVEVKQRIFATAATAAPERAILASNTSSISITVLAAATDRSERVVGMHFMNPVPLMKLVEVIRGQDTSAETTAYVVAAAEALGKVAIAAEDYPGFVSNRVLMPMINEAAFCLLEGVATREGIDGIMKLGMNHPMGPLALADFIGLDVCVNILDVLKDGFGDDKYRACPLLRRMVAAGHLGRKTGKGFYEY